MKSVSELIKERYQRFTESPYSDSSIQAICQRLPINQQGTKIFYMYTYIQCTYVCIYVHIYIHIYIHVYHIYTELVDIFVLLYTYHHLVCTYSFTRHCSAPK